MTDPPMYNVASAVIAVRSHLSSHFRSLGVGSYRLRKPNVSLIQFWHSFFFINTKNGTFIGGDS